MQNKALGSVPVLLGTSAANILSPFTGASSTGVSAGANTAHRIYIIVRHIAVVNKTSGAVSFSMWLGATGASASGTEVIGQGLSVPANDRHDWYGSMRIDDTQFLTGLASASSSLTVLCEGEIGVY